MNLQQWWPWYKQITQTLNLNKEKDLEATHILNKLLKGKTFPLKSLREKIHRKTILIFGAGPSLEEDLKNIITLNIHKAAVLIAADGATTALLKSGIIPDIISTDLDGKIDDIKEANKNGSTIIIHAHGDNIKALKIFVQQFTPPIYGTTQVKPVARVHNVGGFTDGDRPVFTAEKFGASKIILTGMNFGIKIGKYSKPNLNNHTTASPLKRKKLLIAQKLLEWISTWCKADILNVTSHGLEIKGVKKLTYKQLSQII